MAMSSEKKLENIPNGRIETGAHTNKSSSPTKNPISPEKNRTSPTKNLTSPNKGGVSPTKNETPSNKGGISPTKNETSPNKGRTSPTKNQGAPAENNSSSKKTTSPSKTDVGGTGGKQAPAATDRDPRGKKAGQNVTENNNKARTDASSKVDTKSKNETNRGGRERDKSMGPKKGASGDGNGGGGGPPVSAAFKEKFQQFSKFGDTKSDGKLITLSQSDKWMKQAKVVDGKKITTTDTAIHFKKLKSMKVTMKDYNQFIDDLAKTKGVDVNEMRDKLANCGSPATSGTGAENRKVEATVNRLTDVSKYTGSHKQRFDETGKGKGIAGRKDLHDSGGYVQGYQNKNSYSKTH